MVPSMFQAAPKNDYGAKAHQDLIVTRGAGFRKEKNKKKRGSYRGGEITVSPYFYTVTVDSVDTRFCRCRVTVSSSGINNYRFMHRSRRGRSFYKPTMVHFQLLPRLFSMSCSNVDEKLDTQISIERHRYNHCPGHHGGK